MVYFLSLGMLVLGIVESSCSLKKPSLFFFFFRRLGCPYAKEIPEAFSDIPEFLRGTGLDFSCDSTFK
jgi:hypothetical protein